MEAPCIATLRRPFLLTGPPGVPPLADWSVWRRIAHAEARRRLFRSMVAEEIAERALFELVQLHLLGRPPETSTAYLRGVVRRLAARWLASGDSRCQPLDANGRGPSEDADAPLGIPPATMRCSIADFADDWKLRIESILPELERVLTPRQLRVLRAVRACPGLRAAARACAMSPRDLRAAIRRIAAKARALIHAAVPAADGLLVLA